MQLLNDTLMELVLGTPSVCRNLAVFPLISGHSFGPDYVTLDDALDSGGAEVAEVSEGGHVPELRFANRLHERVLLVDGEELVGAKQNRVLNLTILVGAGHTVTIPVSCVEHGRWQYKSRRFASGKRKLYGKLRAKKMASVTRSLREADSRRSDQGEIWDDIALMSARLEACSDTGAMDAMYETHSTRLDEFSEALKPAEHQAGAVFVINGKVAALELFDSAQTFGRLMEKLVGSFAVDALDEASSEAPGVPAAEVVQAFLRRLQSAEVTEHPAVDLGVDVRLTGEHLAGGALIMDGRIVHLSAFNLESDEAGGA